jgi:hypothetical protein
MSLARYLQVPLGKKPHRLLPRTIRELAYLGKLVSLISHNFSPCQTTIRWKLDWHDDDNRPSHRYLGKWNAGTGLMTLAQLFHVPSGFLARLRLLPAAGRFLLWLFSVSCSHSVSVNLHPPPTLRPQRILCWTSQPFICILCILLSCHCVLLVFIP